MSAISSANAVTGITKPHRRRGDRSEQGKSPVQPQSTTVAASGGVRFGRRCVAALAGVI